MILPSDISSMNKSQKFVILLQLLQREGSVNAHELIDRLDLHARDKKSNEITDGSGDRTLRRYISDLRNLPALHNKIQIEGRGVDRRIALKANYQRQGVQLSILEWVSLHFGRSFFRFLEGTNITQDIDDALERLSVITREPDLEMTKNLDLKFMAVLEHAKDHSNKEEIIDDLLSALLKQQEIRAFYAGVKKPLAQYTLRPYTLVTFRQGLYLFAYDVDAQMIKTFAIDRFHQIKILKDKNFSLPNGYNPKDILKDCFGIIGGPLKDIVLRFDSSVAPYIQERIWHHSQEVEAAEHDQVILKMRVGIAPELTNWIMSFGSNVVVINPPELAEDILNRHKKAVEIQQATQL
ncbi:MAG: helix-turn-helix transcriptional regulator [Myxococcota bacterium]